MICLQCGCCCVTMPVIISDGVNWYWKPGDAVCPHLDCSSTRVVCGVHGEQWYKETPCFVYGNPDIDPDFIVKRGKKCSIGSALQQESFDFDRYKKPSLDELEKLGVVS